MNKHLRRLLSSSVWTACRILPQKSNKIVFCSYGGKGYGGNPKAIAEALLSLDRTLDLVWLTRDMSIPLPDGIRPCKLGTPRAVYELSTARVWVDDSRGGAHYKRKNQFYLQTWHGFALKHIERAAMDSLPDYYIEQCKRDSAYTDLIVSGSRFMTRVHKEDFWYAGEVAEYGTPRNDIFFTDSSKLSSRIQKYFSLPADRKLLLYAPTFRADHNLDAYRLDATSAAEACSRRFGGEWSILIRLHPNVSHKSTALFPYDGDRIADATSYPDMQELLAAVDVLITDYSSSMFDFALSGKPCLQFATDIEDYKRDRGFYFPIDSLPFPLARSCGELVELIDSYDADKYRALWKKFTDNNGFCEDGGASVRCAERILDHMNKK